MIDSNTRSAAVVAKSPARIIWFGNEHLGSGLESVEPVILRALIDARYQIAAVVIQDRGGESVQSAGTKALARQHDIPVFDPDRVGDIVEDLKELRPTLGVLVAYGQMVPAAILELFPRGIINIHPSLLPQYRGSTPIEQTLLDGVDQTGVSLMQLEAQMDAGPVFDQAPLPLTGHETKTSLAATLQQLGAEILLKNIDGILAETADARPQDEDQATYCKLLTKADGQINFGQAADVIERQIRALNPWPGIYFDLDGERIMILEAAISEAKDLAAGQLYRDGKNLLLGTADGALILTKLKIAGKKTISGVDYINTHASLETV